jgi:hypothetical protein
MSKKEEKKKVGSGDIYDLAEKETSFCSMMSGKERRTHSRQRTTRSRRGSSAAHASARTDHDILA